jgi:proteasome assembly chaperone (PAC2) family protein
VPGEQSDLVFHIRPDLHAPYFVAAFAGWPDAGEVATGSLRYLRAKLSAQRLGYIEPDPYYEFTTARPVTAIEDGVVQAIRYPASDLFYWPDPQGEHDLVILIASEPQLRWRRYINLLIGLARGAGAPLIVTLGGLFDAVPHTMEAHISGHASTQPLRDQLRDMGVSLSEYQGPASIHSAVTFLCQEEGIPCVSLWGHAPNYVRVTANPKVCHGLLTRLSRLTNLSLNLDDLQVASEYLDAQLNRLLGQNDELRLYVARLEEAYRGERGGPRGEEGEVATESIIREVEEFLRREQRHRDEPEE